MMPTKTKRKFTKGTLPVSAAVRELAEEVLDLGKHGTLTNTLIQALETHKRFLSGDLTPSRSARAN